MKETIDDKTERTRKLNDALRKDLSLGMAVMTPWDRYTRIEGRRTARAEHFSLSAFHRR